MWVAFVVGFVTHRQEHLAPFTLSQGHLVLQPDLGDLSVTTRVFGRSVRVAAVVRVPHDVVLVRAMMAGEHDAIGVEAVGGGKLYACSGPD